MNEFAKNLKMECFYYDISLKVLAAKAGIPYPSLLTYTKKKAVLPRVDVAYKLAKALNVSVEYLLTGKERIDKNTKTYYQTVLDVRNIDPELSKILAQLFYILKTKYKN